jgi:hypothetical protein
MPDGAWAEGWHPNENLDYAQAFGVSSTQFTAIAESQLATMVESELANANHISIFGTGYNSQGSHLIHREGSNHDGAIVIDPLSANARVLLFSFSTQSF